MNKGLMKAAGFKKEVTLVEAGRCPFCRKVVKQADFKDDLSRREFQISGVCQKCQDETFAPPPDEE